MKKVIPFIILGAIVFLFAKCSFVMYSGFKNYPDYASEEVLSKKYQKLIADIDAQIENGESVLSIGANLETINYPKNTVYVALKGDEEGDDDETIVIIGNDSYSRSTFTKSGFGYGTLDQQDIVIIARPINKLGLEEVIVYLKHND